MWNTCIGKLFFIYFFRKKDVADTQSHPWALTVFLAMENVAFYYNRSILPLYPTVYTSAQNKIRLLIRYSDVLVCQDQLAILKQWYVMWKMYAMSIRCSFTVSVKKQFRYFVQIFTTLFKTHQKPQTMKTHVHTNFTDFTFCSFCFYTFNFQNLCVAVSFFPNIKYIFVYLPPFPCLFKLTTFFSGPIFLILFT